MIINSIAFMGVKGRKGSVKLSPITVIAGDNATGKTSIAEAIRLMLTGESLTIGKSNTAIFSARGGFESVSIEAGVDNLAYTRSWTKEGRTIEQKATIPFKTPGVLLDFGVFLAMKPKERTAYLFSLVAAKSGITADAMVAVVSGVRSEIESPTADTEAALRIAEEAVRKFSPVTDLPDMLSCMVDALSTLANNEAAVVKRLKASIEGAETAAAMNPAKPVRANIDTLVAETRKQLEEVRDALTKAIEMARVAEQDNALVAAAEKALDAFKDYSVDADTLLLGSLMDDLSTHPEPEPLNAAVQAFAEGEVLGQRDKTAAFLSKCQKRLAELRGQKSHIESLLKAATERLDAIPTVTACPHCGSSHEGWNGKLVQTAELEVADLKSKLAETKEALAKGEKATTDAQSNLDNITSGLEKLQSDYRNKQREWSEKAKANLSLRQKIAAVEARINKYKAAIVKADAAGTLQDLSPLKAAIERKSTESAGIRATLAELVEEQNRAVAMRSESSRRLAAEAELTKATTSLEVFKLATKAVKARMEQAINVGVGGLFKSAEGLTSVLMDSPVIFRDGEVGRMVDLRFVPLEMFSGAEAMVTYGALSLALSADANIRLVIFDEMGRLDPRRKEWLIERCEQMIVDGQADQFILIDTVPDDYRNTAITTVVRL